MRVRSQVRDGDIASTYLGLQFGFTEANRLAAALLANGGEAAMFLFKAVISLMVIAMVIRLSPRYAGLTHGLYVANGVLGLIVLCNVVQIIAAKTRIVGRTAGGQFLGRTNSIRQRSHWSGEPEPRLFAPAPCGR